jgi:hemoglobin-like flavoprotein
MPTATQIALVQKTFAVIAPIADDAAVLFYRRLFEIDPRLQAMFKGDMTEQRKKLMQMLTAAVKGLDHLERLVPVVEDLGRRHAGYGVADEHYDTVGAALLWTLEKGLGDAFTPEASEGSATAALVTEVDYDTELVTTDTTLSTLNWADGDYVFLKGDRQNLGSSTAVRVCAVGLRSWLPEVRPVTDTAISTLEGTVRSSSSRSYGNYVDGTDKDDMDALEQLVAASVVIGNATDLTAYVSHRRWVAMMQTLETDKRFTSSGTGEGGFLSLRVNAMELKVEIKVDRNQEDDVGYTLQSGAYANVGAGETPHIQMEGDGQWVRVSDDNSSELRIYAVHAFVMYDPAACGVVKFAALN